MASSKRGSCLYGTAHAASSSVALGDAEAEKVQPLRSHNEVGADS